MEEVDELELLVERVAGLDVGKAELIACVRVPHPSKPGRRMQEVRAYATTTAELVAMAVWLRQHRAATTTTPPKPPPWTRSGWLKVAERGMCSPSLVHPEPIRRLRDLTRYRRALVADRGREMQRAEKLLEDAQIKISSVLTEVHGVSGRAMMEALIAGKRDPHTLARLARGRAKVKTAQLEEALRGFFTDHHAVMLRMMLDNIDRISAQITALDGRIEEAVAPFYDRVDRLVDLPGVDRVAAAELIGEIGVDTSRFPTAAHLVSWAKFCPQTHQSAGKTKRKGRGKGNPWLGGTLGRIVFGLSRTDTFLGTRYRRLAKRRGKQKAIVALGNSVLTVVYHLLADPEARFDDLGPGFYESRINTNRRARNLATQLQAITGQKIVIRDGKAVIAESAA